MAAPYEKGELLYEGKAKRIFSVKGAPDLIWQEYKDSLTAFNAQKLGSFQNKGLINREICDLIFDEMEKNGLPTHRVGDAVGAGAPSTVSITKRLE
ncbi:MAG: phosphoribosylaminoimidazolesuccinocarboxamide synthase, partial [Bdellovibrionales bacterium]|nr:phosphoribosylaminoimidazolesuccinocarboxamide synthase [Bdellovibrionales bacterium]